MHKKLIAELKTVVLKMEMFLVHAYHLLFGISFSQGSVSSHGMISDSYPDNDLSDATEIIGSYMKNN